MIEYELHVTSQSHLTPSWPKNAKKCRLTVKSVFELPWRHKGLSFAELAIFPKMIDFPKINVNDLINSGGVY